MKYLKVFFTVTVLLAVTPQLKAQTADEIVQKYIEAIGGAENWRKVNATFYEGDLHVHGGIVKVYKTVLHGKGMRRNMVSSAMNAFEIYTPTEGWEYLPFQGHQIPETVKTERLTKNADLYDAQGVLVDYTSKGHRLTYLGKEALEAKEYHKIKVDHKSGKSETLFFDVSSYLLTRAVTREIINGIESESITKYADYKKLPEGVWFPMSIILPFGEMDVKKVEINKEASANIFKPTS